MKKEQIKNCILAICRDSGIEDLDPDVFDVFPDNYAQIGDFFILDDCLYRGETSGSPAYWPIAKCDDLNKILYRLYEDDRMIDFCFEFSDMLFVLTHNEYRSRELELIIGKEHIKDEEKILSILKERACKGNN